MQSVPLKQVAKHFKIKIIICLCFKCVKFRGKKNTILNNGRLFPDPGFESTSLNNHLEVLYDQALKSVIWKNLRIAFQHTAHVSCLHVFISFDYQSISNSLNLCDILIDVTKQQIIYSSVATVHESSEAKKKTFDLL